MNFAKKHLHQYHFLLLGLIVLLALMLRLWLLDTTPFGMQPDEASWGYNAYSILQTGRDEWGKSYPIIFRAFGDQKLPLYTYSIVPFIWLFDLSILAIRLPAALAGTLLVVFVYLLAVELGFSKKMGLLGALITATCPWLLVISRVFGHDSGFGLLFFTIGLWAFMKNLHEKGYRYVVIASIAFALTWYCYIAYRVSATAILLSLVFIFLRKKYFITNKGILAIGLFVAVLTPLLLLSLSGNGIARMTQVASTNSSGMILAIDEDRGTCTRYVPKVICYIKSNKIGVYMSAFIGRYLRTFSPYYLFVDGDVELEFLNIGKYGLLGIMLMPLYLLGIIYLGHRFVTKQLTRQEIFVLLGLLLTPLAGLLVSNPQKVRLSGLYPFLLILCLYGASLAMQTIKSMKFKKFTAYIWLSILAVSTLFFMIDFLIIHVRKNEISMYEPATKLIKYLSTRGSEQPIYVKGVEDAVIMYAYFKKYDPADFQKNVVRPVVEEGGFTHASSIGNFHKTDNNLDIIYCDSKSEGKDALFATNEDLVKTGLAKKFEHAVYTWDKVHMLYFVYSTKDVIAENVDCVHLQNRK